LNAKDEAMKILIVEDDANSRSFLEQTMEMQGYEYQSAVDGVEGYDKFLSFEPDLILSDIQMPGMDGLALLEKIRKTNPDVVVLMLTAFGSEDFAIQALRLRANNYIKKPVDFSELLPMLSNYAFAIKNQKKFLSDRTGCVDCMKEVGRDQEGVMETMETHYENEIKRLKDENEKLKKEIADLR